MKNLLQKLKDRLRTKTESASAIYWGALTKAAGQESMSERAVEVLLESLEGVLVELGKTVDDVQKDLELVAQLDALKDAPAEIESARAEGRRLVAEADEKTRQAAEHHAEHLRLNQEAEGARNAAQNGQQAALQRMSVYRDLARRLGAAGHPEYVTASTTAAKAREVATLFGDLRNLDLAGQFPHSAESRAAQRRQLWAKLRLLGVRVDDADVNELARIDADLEQRERKPSEQRDQPSEQKCLADLRAQRRQVAARLFAAEAAR